MTLLIILKYFSLMLALVSVIKYVPVSKSNLPTLLLRLALCAVNIFSVVYTDISNEVFAAAVVIVTAIFTEGADLLGKYIVNHFITLLKSNSVLLKLKYVLTLNKRDFGLLILSKAMAAFDKQDIQTGAQILTEYTVKLKGDLLWINNCLYFLSEIGKQDIAYSLLESHRADLTKSNIPYLYLHSAIRVACAKKEFGEVEQYLEYMETHFYDAQHKLTNLQAYLVYYFHLGDKVSFDRIVESQLPLKGLRMVKEMGDNFQSGIQFEHPSKRPKSYQFNFAIATAKSAMPVFIFAALIAAVSVVHLCLSGGGALVDRLIHGTINPSDYFRWGAGVKSLIAQGEWIRLVTPVFLHAGLLHLGLNLYGLVILGRVLCQMFDKFSLFIIFFGGAVVGNILSFYFSDALIAVGASGGVFSFLGALLTYVVWHRKEIYRSAFKKLLVNFAIIAIVQIGISFQIDNIDNMAHIGGFAGGIALAALILCIKNTRVHKYYVNAAKMFPVLLAVALAVYWPPMFTQNLFDKISLDHTVAESGVEYTIPATWHKESDRYFDLVSNSQIIFSARDDGGVLRDEMGKLIEAYTADGAYRTIAETVNTNGWYAVTLTPNQGSETFNLHIFAKQDRGKILVFYLFVDPQVQAEYMEFFQRVLHSAKVQ